MRVDAHTILCIILIYILLKVGEAEHVSILVLSVVLRKFLHRIIRQMDKGIVDVLKIYSVVS